MTEIDADLMKRAVAAERARSRRSRLFIVILYVVGLAPVCYFLLGIMGFGGRQRTTGAVAAAGVLSILILGVVQMVQWITGGVFMTFLSPGGAARRPKGHSRAQSLAIAGDIEGANAEFDALRAEGGADIASLRAEAEMHSLASGDPKRAESLFQMIRRTPTATPSDELYASHRLIDLYLGPLNDSGRVMVELRRMADRFPDTVDGQSALVELKRRRDETPH